MAGWGKGGKPFLGTQVVNIFLKGNLDYLLLMLLIVKHEKERAVSIAWRRGGVQECRRGGDRRDGQIWK